MRKLFLELLGYGLASAAAFAADLSVLYLLVNKAGWHYLWASTLAFVVGATVAYVLSVRFVFRVRQVADIQKEFGYFVGLGVAGLFVNAAALFVAISGAGLHLITAKVLAAGCTFATNFTLRRRVLFTPARSC